MQEYFMFVNACMPFQSKIGYRYFLQCCKLVQIKAIKRFFTLYCNKNIIQYYVYIYKITLCIFPAVDIDVPFIFNFDFTREGCIQLDRDVFILFEQPGSFPWLKFYFLLVFFKFLLACYWNIDFGILCLKITESTC